MQKWLVQKWLVQKWLVWKWIASTIHLQAAEETKSHVKKFNFQPIFGIMTEINWFFFCFCVVYSEKIIHLHFGK